MIEIKKDIKAKDYFKDAKHIINYAFSIGDYHYFRYDDVLNVPYQRALQCLVYYRELDMNCDRKFIEAHTMAFDNALKSKQITIDTLIDLKKLNDQLKDRLKLPKEPELMYKLASVVFFDQHENPNVYEFKYGEGKIRHWKKESTLADFFLSKPLKTLIPYLQYAEKNLEEFSQMINKETEQHSKKILSMLSEEQKRIFNGKLI